MGTAIGTAGVIIIIAVIVLLIAYIMFKRAYRVAAPNEALVITGRSPKKKGDIDLESGTRIVVGGRAFIRPLFERSHSLTLSSRQIEIQAESYSSNGIFLNLNAVAQVKIGESAENIRKAAQRFLDQQDEIDSFTQDILSGALRSVVGTLTVREVLQDRKTFAQNVQETAVDSMNNQGLIIDTLQVITVSDDGEYLSDFGRPEAAEMARQARIAESKSNRESTEAENQDQQNVADSQKALDLRRAEIQKDTAGQRAEAEAAEELAKAKQRQSVLDEQQTVTEKNNDIKERELIGEVQKPADADKYAAERKADSARYSREQDSAAALTEANNEAEAVRARGESEATTIRAKGQAEADSVEASAKAHERFNDAAVLGQVLEALPGIAREIAAPMSDVDSLSIVSSDGESKLSDNVATGTRKTMDMVKSTTGIDVGSLISRAMESSGGADGFDSSDGEAPGEADGETSRSHASEAAGTQNEQNKQSTQSTETSAAADSTSSEKKS